MAHCSIPGSVLNLGVIILHVWKFIDPLAVTDGRIVSFNAVWLSVSKYRWADWVEFATMKLSEVPSHGLEIKEVPCTYAVSDGKFWYKFADRIDSHSLHFVQIANYGVEQICLCFVYQLLLIGFANLSE